MVADYKYLAYWASVQLKLKYFLLPYQPAHGQHRGSLVLLMMSVSVLNNLMRMRLASHIEFAKFILTFKYLKQNFVCLHAVTVFSR